MIITGDCLEVMKTFPDNHFSCVVTDPPYGLGFMGKKWDAGLPHGDIWKEALRIVKPGGHVLSFGGTRTYHRLTCAIEDAGWEIRDCLMWIYGSGFPKSHNHFGLDGYGTALKPAYEPIIMAMKPLEGTFKQNAEKWEQAGINIDACRIGENRPATLPSCLSSWRKMEGRADVPVPNPDIDMNKGRWPANVILDEEAGAILDEQAAFNPSRFFYCAKSSSSERNEGLEGLPSVRGGTERMNNSDGRKKELGETERFSLTKNNHPTVKPLKLMEYLIRLVMPPKDGLLLDPFSGSGSTIVAAQRLGMKAIGIEKSEEYAEIAKARVANVGVEKTEPQLELFG